MAIPDSKKIYPREGDDTIVYLKNVITNTHIEVRDFDVQWWNLIDEKIAQNIDITQLGSGERVMEV